MKFGFLLLASGLALSSLSPAQNCVEGCTPGFWKTHPRAWDGMGGDDFTSTILKDDLLNATLGIMGGSSPWPDTLTLIQAADLSGGSNRALARHAAAALANSDSNMFYMYSTSEVIDIVLDGLGILPGSLDVESAKDTLEVANEQNCPWSAAGPTGPICDFTVWCTGEDVTCPCGNELPDAGCQNSTGNGAQLSVVSGTNSVLADDLVITTTGLPPNELTIGLAAVGTGAVSFGNGVLCVANGSLKIFRFPIANSGPAGQVTYGPGIVDISQTVFTQPVGIIDPGETYIFQTWYRDPGGPCGFTYNTSNAITVNYVN